MATGFRDIHAHFIYGIDDGAQTKEDMLAMLDDAHLCGISELYATSHSTPGIQHFPEEVYFARLAEARAYCKEKGYQIKIRSGTEILYTPALKNYLERKPLRTMGKSDFVLIEFVPDISYAEVKEAVSLVEGAGYIPILAHVERYECLQSRKIWRLKKEHNVRYQVNCGTLVKRKGFLRTRRIRKWFRKGLIDYVASDMHDLRSRRNRMQEAARMLEGLCSQSEISRMMYSGEPLT